MRLCRRGRQAPEVCDTCPYVWSERSGCCAGMINGQLFRKVMANSPGGILADSSQGQPPIFISAGLQDNIFPIQQAGNAVRPPSSLVGIANHEMGNSRCPRVLPQKAWEHRPMILIMLPKACNSGNMSMPASVAHAAGILAAMAPATLASIL